MDFMTIILAVVAVYVAKPAFTGKGKLMQLEGIKEGKEKIAKKGLRISYLIMFFCSLIMILITVLQNKGFETQYKVTFTEEVTYTENDVTTVYAVGQEEIMSESKITSVYSYIVEQKNNAAAEEAASAEEPAATAAPATSGFSCMPTTSSSGTTTSLPFTYELAGYEATTEFAKKIPGKDGDAKWKFIRVMSIVFFAISVADIVFLLVFTSKITDKEKKKKAQAATASNRRVSMPRGAFDFDQEEPFAPDDPKTAMPEEKK